MTYKNHEAKIVKHQDISRTRKGHWVFHETARQRTLLGKMSFGNVELATYTPPVVLVRRFKHRLCKQRRFRHLTSYSSHFEAKLNKNCLFALTFFYFLMSSIRNLEFFSKSQICNFF
jgi:hypothetical protein